MSTSWRAIAAALVFAGASLIRDIVLLRIFSFGIFPDSGSYVLGRWLRSRPYPVMAWVTDAAHHPSNLILLQIAVGAIAVGALVYVMARRHMVLAVIVGVLLVTDLGWATFDRWILTEGPFMSFAVLSLAIFVDQYENRSRLRPWALVGAGALFAWTATIRPSNLYLLVPITLAYFVFTRFSFRLTAWLATGILAVLLGSSLLMWAQTGAFRVSSGTGYFVAFPLFSYHLFDPSNGPASARIDSTLRSCDSHLDYSSVTISTSNEHLWGDYLACLDDRWNFDQVDSELTAAYVEGIRAKPASWSYDVFAWNVVELGYRVRPIDEEPVASECDPNVFVFCADWHRDMESRPSIAVPLASSETWFQRGSGLLRQPYAAPLYFLTPSDPEPQILNHALWWPFILAVAVTWLVILAAIWFGSRGMLRFMALSSAALVFYVCLTVPSGHVFLARYVAVLSPFYAVVASIAAYGALRLVLEIVRRRRHPESTEPA